MSLISAGSISLDSAFNYLFIVFIELHFCLFDAGAETEDNLSSLKNIQNLSAQLEVQVHVQVCYTLPLLDFFIRLFQLDSGAGPNLHTQLLTKEQRQESHTGSPFKVLSIVLGKEVPAVAADGRRELPGLEQHSRI
jgi:hypothetical protein